MCLWSEPSARSDFEVAIASVSATAFIESRPYDRSMMAAANSVFYLGDIKRFLSIATEQTLQFPHPSARLDDIFVSLDRVQAAFQASSTSVEQQAGSDAQGPRRIPRFGAASSPRPAGSSRQSAEGDAAGLT